MALLAYNKSGAALILVAGVPLITLPASGAAVDVTASLTGLTVPNYNALEAQRVAPGTKVRYKWTSDADPGWAGAGILLVEEPHQDLEVADLATLTNLDDADVPDASECLVLTLGQYFRLDKSYAGAADGITVIAASVGKWLRLIAPVPKWTAQSTWKVDPAAGNDEADGLTIGTAIKTLKEWCRRVTRFKATSSYATGYDIECLNTVPDGDVFRPSGTFEPGQTSVAQANTNVFPITLRGTTPAVAVSGAGAGALSALSVPATNTPAKLDANNAGFVWGAAYIDRLVKMTSGDSTRSQVAGGDNGKDFAASLGIINVAQTTAAPSSGTITTTTGGVGGATQTLTYTGKTGTSFTGVSAFTGTLVGGNDVIFDGVGAMAWITKDLGGGIAQVSEWVTVTGANTVTLVTNAAWIVGQTYDVLNFTEFKAELNGVGAVIIRYRFKDLYISIPFGSVANETFTLKSVAASFITCRIDRKIAWYGSNGTYWACGFGFDVPGSAVITTMGVLDGCAVTFNSCAMRNVELSPANGANVAVQDVHMEKSYVRPVLFLAVGVPAFGGTFSLGNGIGSIAVRGTKGLGAHNSTRSGIVLRRGGQALIVGPLWGAGNAEYGVDVREGCKMYVLAGQIPTITGATAAVRLDGMTHCFQALEGFAGGVLPAPVPLTTWVQWNDAVVPNVSGFARNVMSYKTGASIMDASAT
jgi:hypothetical protein